MPIFDTFSKRQRAAARAGKVDVYTYDVPKGLRIQVAGIMRRGIGDSAEDYISIPVSPQLWQYLVETFAEEAQLPGLGNFRYGPDHQYMSFFVDKATDDQAVDMIELAFHGMNSVIREHHGSYNLTAAHPDDSIKELNARFLENKVGYQFVNGQIIKLDDDFTHHDIVRPALAALTAKGFEGAQEEFMIAHRKYREGDTKGCLVECLKTFESTIKVILTKRRIPYPPTANASNLIGLVFDNGIIPAPLQSEFTALKSVLESGVPTMRNKMGGHGQGETVTSIPDYLASYCLSLTAANVVLLINAHA